MRRRTFLTSGLAAGALGGGKAAAQAGAPFVDTHMHPLRGLVRGQSVSGAISNVMRLMDRFGVSQAILLPPPYPEQDQHVYGLRELSAAVRGNKRLAFTAGGDSLNPLLQSTPVARAASAQRSFLAAAEEIAAAGAAAFGEIALEHFSSGRGQHPYEASPPDHPLLLALADFAARQGMPLELHMEAVPQDMAFPPERPRGPNPDRVAANIAAFERLLAHNRQARIVWSHAGWDLTGQRTPQLMGELLRRHANLFMNIKSDRAGVPHTSPFDPQDGLKPEWLALLRGFPDRFMVGSDEFADAGTDRIERARRLVDLLPADISRPIASDNARRVYRLPPA
jgi:predicted TIM-barrel fold metal-dependent hydrolase